MQSIHYYKIILYAIVLLVAHILSSVLIESLGSGIDRVNSDVIEYIGFGLVNIMIFSFLAKSHVKRLYLHAFLIYILFSITIFLVYWTIFRRIPVPQERLFLDVVISIFTIMIGLRIGILFSKQQRGRK